jgi:hypothetical protein
MIVDSAATATTGGVPVCVADGAGKDTVERVERTAGDGGRWRSGATAAVLVLLVASCGCGGSAERLVASSDQRFVAALSRTGSEADGSLASFVVVTAVCDSWLPCRKRAVFVTNGGFDISLVWNEHQLEIRCPACLGSRVQVQETQWEDVGVRYPEFGVRAAPDR